MNKVVLSVLSFFSCCIIFTACSKQDNTPAVPPMTASFTLPTKSAVAFVGSYISAAITSNAADTNHHIKDSTLTISGKIYIPNTVKDSILEIDITIFKYNSGMKGISIDNDTFAYAQIITPSGTHVAAQGSVFFNAATPFGASGTFNFNCSDQTSVNAGTFVASWRQ